MPQRDTQKERAEVLADATLTEEERQAKLKELDGIDFMRKKYAQLYAQEILMAPELRTTSAKWITPSSVPCPASPTPEGSARSALGRA